MYVDVFDMFQMKLLNMFLTAIV